MTAASAPCGERDGCTWCRRCVYCGAVVHDLDRHQLRDCPEWRPHVRR